jgi:hypothetical protein
MIILVGIILAAWSAFNSYQIVSEGFLRGNFVRGSLMHLGLSILIFIFAIVIVTLTKKK